MKIFSISVVFLLLLMKFDSQAFAEAKVSNTGGTMKAQVSTLFYWCNDIDKTRSFYTDVLGLKETSYRNDDKMGWLGYELDNLALYFLRSTKSLLIAKEWARQPGWTEGTLEAHSLILQVGKADFDAVVSRAKNAGVKIHDKEPRGESSKYLQHFLMDPMGNTVELYYEAKDS